MNLHQSQVIYATLFTINATSNTSYNPLLMIQPHFLPHVVPLVSVCLCTVYIVHNSFSLILSLLFVIGRIVNTKQVVEK